MTEVTELRVCAVGDVPAGEARRFDVEPHLTGIEIVRVKPAQNDIGIRDRRRGTAVSVASRTRLGAG